MKKFSIASSRNRYLPFPLYFKTIRKAPGKILLKIAGFQIPVKPVIYHYNKKSLCRSAACISL
jgi:hypothetical protein